MTAIDIHAEFRKAFPARAIAPTEARVLAWADSKVQWDGWVKNDGQYYTREAWDAWDAEYKRNSITTDRDGWLQNDDPYAIREQWEIQY